MVILDELNVVLSYEYLPLDDVLQELKQKRPDLHVVLTGRGRCVRRSSNWPIFGSTEMKLVKHPYREQGVKTAKKGSNFEHSACGLAVVRKPLWQHVSNVLIDF